MYSPTLSEEEEIEPTGLYSKLGDGLQSVRTWKDDTLCVEAKGRKRDREAER